MDKIETLDRLVSLYVRTLYASHEGINECYTCSVKLPWEQLQCGHFHLRGNNGTRFDLDNLRPQCPTCNMERNGMPEAFEERLREELGEEDFEALRLKAREPMKFDDKEIQELINYYRVTLRKKGIII